MLKKNVYITYPAGYAGTYLNWIIYANDQDLITVDDPITSVANMHGHVKLPTHQNLQKTLWWMMLHKPKEKLVYAIYAHNSNYALATPAAAADFILRTDPDPVILNITDNDEDDVKKFGVINVETKWPTYLAARNCQVPHWNYNPFQDSDKPHAEAWLSKYWQMYIPSNGPLDRQHLDKLLQEHRTWIQVRNETAPEEVNSRQYYVPDDVPDNTIFDINLRQIFTPEFPAMFQNILERTECIDSDYEQLHSFHPRFLQSQRNRHWFADIENYRSTGEISDFLKSTTSTRAFLLLEKFEPRQQD